MSRQFDVAEADRFRLGDRLGQPPKEEHLRQFGPVRLWRPIRDDRRTLDLAEALRPLSARKPWTWWLHEGDPWALDRGATDLLVAIAASCGACYGRVLFLFETNEENAFLAWKHSLMAEGTGAIIRYLSDADYQKGSAARAALNPPMGDPKPPTGEVRALYDRAIAHAEALGVIWPEGRGKYGSLPQCHWQTWPIQHLLVAGVGRGWAR